LKKRPVILIGLLCFAAALAYSGGPFPLASHGLGDLFVFIFFGLGDPAGLFPAFGDLSNAPYLEKRRRLTAQ
jgi:1,4-dihydroxy-2-naphthoate octaprenyltransferase